MEKITKQIDIELASTDSKHLQNVLMDQQQQIESLTNIVDKLQSTLYSVLAHVQDSAQADQDTTNQEWLSWKRPTD